MIDEDWGGFAAAFTETARPEAARGPYGKRMLMAGFLSMPLSGRAASYDAARFALWKFSLGTDFSSASCRLAAYVPDNGSIVSVGGAPASYYYYADDYSAGSAVPPAGGFQVDQVS